MPTLVPDRPAHLVSPTGTSWANSGRWRYEITKRTPDPANGSIVRDRRTGEPTGVLKEAAMSLVSGLIPPATRADRAQALRTAMTEANRHGITSVQNAGGRAEDLDIFEEARRAGDLQTRLYSAVTVGRALTEADLDRLDASRKRHQDDAIFKTGALKIALDGVVEGHTAVMPSPRQQADGRRAVNPLPDDLTGWSGWLTRKAGR